MSDGTNIGRVMPAFLGEWSSQIEYKVLDLVTYPTTGFRNTYICIKDTTTGIDPENTEYWNVALSGIPAVPSNPGNYYLRCAIIPSQAPSFYWMPYTPNE